MHTLYFKTQNVFIFMPSHFRGTTEKNVKTIILYIQNTILGSRGTNVTRCHTPFSVHYRDIRAAAQLPLALVTIIATTLILFRLGGGGVIKVYDRW